MHFFLCGDKQVGKSTLIRKILDKAVWKYDGLLSFSRFVDGDRHVFLKSVKGDEEGVLCGICSNHHVTERHPEVFDLVGSPVLTQAGLSADVVVIDEIGSMEREATIYSTCIRDLVSAPSPVILGVLQDMCQTELAKWLRSSENIIWYRVTEENREDLVNEISGRISDELFRQTGSR